MYIKLYCFKWCLNRFLDGLIPCCCWSDSSWDNLSDRLTWPWSTVGGGLPKSGDCSVSAPWHWKLCSVLEGQQLGNFCDTQKDIVSDQHFRHTLVVLSLSDKSGFRSYTSYLLQEDVRELQVGFWLLWSFSGSNGHGRLCGCRLERPEQCPAELCSWCWWAPVRIQRELSCGWGLSVTFGTDADNSVPGAWLLHFSIWTSSLTWAGMMSQPSWWGSQSLIVVLIYNIYITSN